MISTWALSLITNTKHRAFSLSAHRCRRVSGRCGRAARASPFHEHATRAGSVRMDGRPNRSITDVLILVLRMEIKLHKRIQKFQNMWKIFLLNTMDNQWFSANSWMKVCLCHHCPTIYSVRFFFDIIKTLRAFCEIWFWWYYSNLFCHALSSRCAFLKRAVKVLCHVVI
jgi:hypothetical protein